MLGDFKDAQEALLVIDMVTGEKLSIKDRFITAGAMFVPVVNGKALREGIGLAADGAEIIARHGDEAVDIVRHGDDILDSTRAGEKAIDGYETAEKIGKNTTPGVGSVDTPPAFRQNEFASSYEARIGQTPRVKNKTVGFEGSRGESLCALKPPPDPEIKKILDEAGIDGIQYRNGVPDFSPVTKAQVEIDHMYGGIDDLGTAARRANFGQADIKLAEQLNNSPEFARQFGMEPGTITAKDIEKYRIKNELTWHELNDVKTIQLVPSKINKTFGHLGGVGEINAGAFEPSGFANE